jgi:hypothetical protein
MVNQNSYHVDPYTKEFGIKISEHLASVEAWVLPAPPVSGNLNLVDTMSENSLTCALSPSLLLIQHAMIKHSA